MSKQQLEKFDKVRPRTKKSSVVRLTSWADPVSAAAEEDEQEHDSIPLNRREISYTADLPPIEQEEEFDLEVHQQRVASLRRLEYIKGVLDLGLYPFRRHSFDTMQQVELVRILPVEYLKIDVDLCGEMLVARVREKHLKDVLALIKVRQPSSYIHTFTLKPLVFAACRKLHFYHHRNLSERASQG